jgi:hypothetical protein
MSPRRLSLAIGMRMDWMASHRIIAKLFDGGREPHKLVMPMPSFVLRIAILRAAVSNKTMKGQHIGIGAPQNRAPSLL